MYKIEVVEIVDYYLSKLSDLGIKYCINLENSSLSIEVLYPDGGKWLTQKIYPNIMKHTNKNVARVIIFNEISDSVSRAINLKMSRS